VPEIIKNQDRTLRAFLEIHGWTSNFNSNCRSQKSKIITQLMNLSYSQKTQGVDISDSYQKNILLVFGSQLESYAVWFATASIQ